MADRASKISGPSLLEPKATGGLHAGDGLSVQERYAALQVPGWLADPTFERFQPERAEDVDVWFEGEAIRDHHQVKAEHLAQGDIKSLIEEFRGRFEAQLREGRVRRFVIAAAYLGPELRAFVKQLKIYRTRHFGTADADERNATLATLRDSASRLRLDGQLDFIVERVHFDDTLAALDGDVSDVRATLAARLAKHLGCNRIDEADHVATVLMTALHADRRRSWTRHELEAQFATARAEFRAGPARPAGDLVLFCHQTLKRVDQHPERDAAPPLFEGRRVVHVQVDDTSAMARLDAEAITRAAITFGGAASPWREVLQRTDARVLYYGFPHVPFGMLAGFVAQAHHAVGLVEHDLETGHFHWRPDAVIVGANGTGSTSGSGSIARLRVSVSARVREDACDRGLRARDVGLDLHVEADDIGRGTVTSEAQARQHAARVRKLLDNHLAGNSQFTSLHVFAAVPVSVAFAVGQVLGHSSLPPCYIYNFDALAVPQYRWRLGLREAVEGRACVDVLPEVRDVPA